MGLLKIFCILLKNARHRNFHGLCLNVNSVIVTHLCASQEIFQIFNIDWLVQRAFRRIYCRRHIVDFLPESKSDNIILLF